MFSGSMVALVTPMDNLGEVDYVALDRLLEWHMASSTSAMVVLGTTGEAATINSKEREQIIRKTVEKVSGKIPVIAGTGATNPKVAIQLTQQAMELGVDGCLVMTPAYVKPTQRGLYLHHKMIADAVAIPQILYNVPSRTACDMTAKTVKLLSDIPNIVAIKEASGDPSRVKAISQLCEEKLSILSGEDSMAYESMLEGANGVISVTANIAPKLMSELWAALVDGDKPLADLINHKLMPLHEALFIETNPIAVKWALSEMGYIGNYLRLPLTKLDEKYQQHVKDAMLNCQII